MKGSNFKRIISISVLVILTIATIAGCGKTTKEEVEGTGENNQAASVEVEKPEEAKAETAETEVAEEEPADQNEAITVGISLNAMDEYATNWLDIFTTLIEENGGKVVSTNAESNVSKQISDVDTLIAQQVDVILIRPIDSEAVTPAGEAVKSAEIPLIVVDGAIPDLNYGISLVVDQGVNGELLGEYINQWLDEDPSREANVGYIVGMYLDIVMPRMDKIFENCPRAVKVIEAQGDWNADKGMKITEDWLQAHPEINVIAAMNDEMAIGAIQALVAADKNLDDYLVLGVDGTLNGQSYIKSGELDATTYAIVKEQVAQVAEATVALANGESYEKSLDKSSIKLMTKDNIDELITE